MEISLKNGISIPSDAIKFSVSAPIDNGIEPKIPISLVQYDTGLAIVAFTILENNQIYVPSEDADIKVRVGKPDNKGVYRDILGTDSNGIVYFKIESQMTTTVGVGSCCIEINTSSGIKNTKSVPIYISKNPVDYNSIVSSDDFQALSEFTNKAEKFSIASQSWAVGNTGSRDGENTDNSKYYYQESKNSADSALKSETLSSQYCTNAQQYSDSAKISAENAELSSKNAPKLSSDDTWMVWNSESRQYEDTKVYAGGQAPSIGENGHWFVGGKDTGISATGPIPQFSIGDVETLEPGIPGEVTISGNAANPSLNFKIPVFMPSIFLGATGSANGKEGIVPAPSSGQQNYVLLGNATWAQLTKAMVGLNNVDNTSDSDKSVKYANTAGSAKNPEPLTISLNGVSKGAYDGSTAISFNINAQSVGAANSNHSHSTLFNATSNPITSTDLDTPENWSEITGNNVTTVHWFNKSVLQNQPSSWGFLLNMNQSGYIHQVYFDTNPNGKVYHRTGKPSGWNDNFRLISE